MKKSDVWVTIWVRYNLLLGDCRTFLYAKTQPDFRSHNLGGGNFVLGLASMSYLEMLAGVHASCINPDLLYNDMDVSDSKATRKALISAGLKEKVGDKYQLRSIVGPAPKSGTQKMVIRSILLLQAESKINLGLPESQEDAQKIWTSLRNRLSHSYCPASDASLSGFEFEEMKLADAEMALRADERRCFERVNHPQFGMPLHVLHPELLIVRDLVALLQHAQAVIDNCTEKSASQYWSTLLGVEANS